MASGVRLASARKGDSLAVWEMGRREPTWFPAPVLIMLRVKTQLSARTI